MKRPFIFLFEWRSFSPFRFIMYFFMFASVPMLGYGIQPYTMDIIKTIVFTIIVLYSGFFAVIIWNDICDADIDSLVHPTRAVPTGKIGKRKFFAVALIFAGFVFLFSYLINLKCFLFVGVAALFVAIHNKYFKKRIRLPAYSEITTPLQWIIIPIFGYLAINNFSVLSMVLLVVFTYLADVAHDLPEGVHDAEGDRRAGVYTYTTSFGEKTAARISFLMLFFAGVTGIVLVVEHIVTIIFFVPFMLLWIYTLNHSYTYVRMNAEDMKKYGLITGLKLYSFFWGAYVFIFFDVLIRLVLGGL